MGSLVPTPSSSTPPLFSGGGTFPQEILAEFAEHLSDKRYRKDLLNLSLASRSFRHEAQRVLFRTLESTHPTELASQRNSSDLRMKEMITHRLFLRAIINSPTYLSHHVHTYRSQYLALVPANSDEHDHQRLLQSNDNYWTAGCELWNLTARALPLLTQLRSLTVSLSPDWTYMRRYFKEPSPFRGTSILQRCSFTLDSFAWADRDLHTGISELQEFLSRQPRLQSLDIRCLLPSDQIPELQFDAQHLPRLHKLTGPFFLLPALLSRTRRIDTLSWQESRRPNNMIFEDDLKLALRFVKNLSLPVTDLLNTMGPSLLSVETLFLKELTTSWHEDMAMLGHLRSLRVLIVVFTTHTPDSRRVAMRAFNTGPVNLQRVYCTLGQRGLCRVFRLDENRELRMAEESWVQADIIRLCRPWIPLEQPTWNDVKEYV